MPQTREHLAILDLLGISRGLVALTKIDLVDEEWLALVREEIDRALAGTTLAELVEQWSKKVGAVGLREYYGVEAWDWGLPGRMRGSRMYDPGSQRTRPQPNLLGRA